MFVNFTAHLGNFLIYFWHEYYHAVNMVSDCIEFWSFFLKRPEAEATVLHVEALYHSHCVSEAYHTLKLPHTFIMRTLEKMLNMMNFGNLKPLIAKTVLTRVEKM